MIYNEYTMNIKYIYSLYEPCLKNSKYWINYFIEKGADDWDTGLRGVYQGRHIDLVNIMLQLQEGAKYWNWGLWGACKGGHIDLVNMMLQKGADVNYGLYGACEGGHLDIINTMIAKRRK